MMVFITNVLLICIPTKSMKFFHVLTKAFACVGDDQLTKQRVPDQTKIKKKKFKIRHDKTANFFFDSKKTFEIQSKMDYP